LVTLIRHGQAGSRLVYDDLSKKGHEQARALGAWFGERGVRFDAILAGGLSRQQMTANTLMAAMEEHGAARPDLVIDTHWNEFDLDAVYEGIGPLLARESEQFRLEYEQLQQDACDPESSAHRAWRHCDTMVVRAWLEGRFEFGGESFSAFQARVREGLFQLPAMGHVAVVTSATPIGVCVGTALDLSPKRVMQLGPGFNTAFSEMDLRPGDPRLVSFHNTPHLREERLRTFR
jgi:broad specificity phosphatase PhoE